MTELKRVSFNVAKAIKEAGYTVDITEDNEDNVFVVFSDEPNNSMSYQSADIQGYLREYDLYIHNIEWCFCPTYMQVWLWLWREKKINVTPIMTTGIIEFWSRDGGIHTDPEEAIIAAIEYLVTNDLIK